MKCWASSVSECCSTQSREHYITKGLFKGKMLYVNNAPFLGGGSKQVSKASLTKKCLCKKHNELLSIFDSEAIIFGQALEYALNLSQERRNSKAKKFSVHRKTINFDKFSKWFIKTFLGLHDFFKYPSLFNEPYLANLVFSKNKITGHLNLNIEMSQNEEFAIEEIISIAPLERNEFTIGMQIELYGIRINGVFNDKPNNLKHKPIKLKFNEHKQGLSCIVSIS